VHSATRLEKSSDGYSGAVILLFFFPIYNTLIPKSHMSLKIKFLKSEHVRFSDATNPAVSLKTVRDGCVIAKSAIHH
jgi:hypothetical protein